MNERAWENIVKVHENDEIVEGLVKTRTKGGLVVEVLGLDAFLPGSQIDIKPIRDYDIYVNRTMQFKVVKLNHQFKNVVVSHKVLIEDDIEAQKSDILKKLEKGQVLEGVVKNMTSFGVFIDLGGLDGLLHITDISWGRINHPEEVLHLDQKINVAVLDYDPEKNRISLGLKQLTPHPWDNLAANLEVGNKIKGKIVTVADYGAFVEIAPGVEGLIHVSELSWSSHLRNPQDFLKVGEEIEAVILSIDKEERKMSLGVKQLTSDPWGNIADRYPVGSKHKGIVRNMTSYGLFVELEPGVDGLLHVSDLSWTKKIKHPNEFVKKDQELDVIVLELDVENRRLSLGHRQLEENPWDTFETVFPVGSEHEATVLKIQDKAATLALQYGVEGYANLKQLQKEDKSTAKEDEVINVKVIEFNKENKRIVVSHTALWKEEEMKKADEAEKKSVKDAEKTVKNVKKINEKNSERSTMADLEGLSELKAKMEAAKDDKAE
jgi:small subunit ribosomal protein S1